MEANAVFSTRNRSIDVFRALTMFLMVTVNDFWTVLDVPKWLLHTETSFDGMGLSDIVYPMFLLVMGMSIPYAMERRFSKGDTPESVLLHVIKRSFTLILMGVLLVNSEGTIAPLLGYSKGVYWLLMLLGIFLIWNVYPAPEKRSPVVKKLVPVLKAVGIAALLFLLFTYRSPKGGAMVGSWWGILGQLGWSYLFCAFVYFFARKCPRPVAPISIVYGILVLANMYLVRTRTGDSLGFLPRPNVIGDIFDAIHVGRASSQIMTLGGVLLSLVGASFASRSEGRKLSIGFAAAALFLVLGFVARTEWIISKNIGTLPWCFIVTAISIALYTLLRFLEGRGHLGWTKPILPAGTSTLTVYMIPYFYYSLWVVFSMYPLPWLTGWIGVCKCVLFSFLCIGTAWCLEKLGIKLKI